MARSKKPAPKNGDLVKCDRCRCCHRLTTPRHKITGEMIPARLVFVCNGILRDGAKSGKLEAGLSIHYPDHLAEEIYKPESRISSRSRD